MSNLLPKDFHKLPLGERRRWLEANADRTSKQKTVFKDLSESQMDQLETQISSQATELQDEESSYKEVQKEFRNRINDMKDSLKEMINQRKTGQEEIVTDIYYIADQDEGRMYGYASDGVLVENRRLTEEERQTTIHSMNRTAN